MCVPSTLVCEQGWQFRPSLVAFFQSNLDHPITVHISPSRDFGPWMVEVTFKDLLQPQPGLSIHQHLPLVFRVPGTCRAEFDEVIH